MEPFLTEPVHVLELGTDLVLALELTRLSIVGLLVHEFLRDKLATITLWTLRHQEEGYPTRNWRRSPVIRGCSRFPRLRSGIAMAGSAFREY